MSTMNLPDANDAFEPVYKVESPKAVEIQQRIAELRSQRAIMLTDRLTPSLSALRSALPLLEQEIGLTQALVDTHLSGSDQVDAEGHLSDLFKQKSMYSSELVTNRAS